MLDILRHSEVEINYAEKIQEAVDVLSGVSTKTDVRNLSWLKRLLGINVYAKCEHAQKTGSFKFRGAYYRLSKQPKSRPVIAASAGNHALGIAEAASCLDIKANICVPTSVSPVKWERLASYGHSLINEGSSLEEATEHAKKLAFQYGWDFISPYNDVDLIAGQATVGVEFLQQCHNLTHIIVPVGGGGLISGVALAAKDINPNIKIIGVEPEYYASVANSLSENKVTRVPNMPTLADGLAVNLEDNSVTFGLIKDNIDQIVVVSEEELAAGTLAMIKRESQLVEPAGAAGIAALIAGKIQLPADSNVGVILSGGNVSEKNISTVLNYPFKDKQLFDCVDFRGVDVKKSVYAKGIDLSSKEINQPDRADETSQDIEFLKARFSGIEDMIAQINRWLSDYLGFCEAEGLNIDNSAVEIIRRTEEIVKKILSAINLSQLNETKEASQYNSVITEMQQKYRALIQLLLPMFGALDWRSASCDQSKETMFFNTKALAGGVNYNRYESDRIVTLEKQLADIINVNQRETRVFMASSGMSAYNILEAYLLRYVLLPGDTILLPHYIYFENEEQIAKLQGFNIVKDNAHTPEEVAMLVKQNNPKVVFLDPLNNDVDLRLHDVSAMLDGIQENADQDVICLIDGTMLSGCLNMNEILYKPRGKVKVLYFESASKYLQLGLDLMMAGLVAVPVEQEAIFERLRRNTGGILYEPISHIFPNFTREEHIHRMQRMSRNALMVTEDVNNDVLINNSVKAIYPGHKDHVDFNHSIKVHSAGGVMTFQFSDLFLNQRNSLNDCIKFIIEAAREIGVAITKGVSFGFSIPRISAASAMAETCPPFLRLHVGDRSFAETELLSQAVRQGIYQYLSSINK